MWEIVMAGVLIDGASKKEVKIFWFSKIRLLVLYMVPYWNIYVQKTPGICQKWN